MSDLTTDEKYMKAIELIGQISAIISDLPENKPIKKLIYKFADEVL